MSINIGIVGYGIVGQALAYGFSRPEVKNRYLLHFHDKYKRSLSLEKVARQSEFIFVCLPTPMRRDESGIDLEIVEKNVDRLSRFTDRTEKIIVIKSTVMPGTTAKLEKKYSRSRFAFNPEFLTEANYLEDFINADRTIIGANNDLVSRRLVVLFRERFPRMKIFQTDPTTAEMVKYMANAYLATKVIFANQIYDLCQALGVNYDEMKKMAVADRRIYDSHLDVTSERGFGKKCLPKDLVALLGLARRFKVDCSLLEEVWRINKKIRKVKDWEEIPFAVSGQKTKSRIS